MPRDEKYDGIMIILTGPSGSGKSTITNKLKEDFGFTQPTQFTTRKMRNESELDEYVFLDKETFLKKLMNWDFVEHTLYWDNFYWLGKYFKSDYNVCILDPIGREQVRAYCNKNNIKCVCVYLEIDKETLEYRLGMLRREDCNTIKKRLDDFFLFSPRGADIVIDATVELKRVYANLITKLERCGILER